MPAPGTLVQRRPTRPRSRIHVPCAWQARPAFDLRCVMREKLIAFLRAEFPSALPHTRAELTLDEATAAGVANRGAVETETAPPTRVAGAGR